MEERTKGMLYVLKEVFKLPLNKETKTIKYTDAIELIERISNEIPGKDVAEFMNEVKI